MVKTPNVKKTHLGWERKEVDIANQPVWAEPIDEMWCWKRPTATLVIQLHNLGIKCCGETIHVTVKKVDVKAMLQNKFEALFNSIEPDYSEKVAIVKKLINRNDIVVIEVFPRQKDVVDYANLYHIWVVEKAKFPFSTLETTKLPEDKEWESENVGGIDIEHMMRVVKTPLGKVAYQYLRRKDGQELRWVEKQMIKNELQSEELMAVEIISGHGTNKPTCLMYLPIGYFLDFGLHLN